MVVAVARLLQDNQTGTATWDASRASGFVTYLLLWASTLSGIAIHLRIRPGAGPLTWVLEVHRIVSVLAVSFLAAHVAGMLLDPVVTFGVADGFVPFTSDYRPIQVGLGTVAQWLTVVVLVSTAFANRMSWTKWRQLHLLSYPAYLLALVHGITAGSDSAASAVVVVYAATAASVAAVGIIRLAGRGWASAPAEPA